VSDASRPSSTVDPLDDLRSATCSNGAPSARNLLVTVFGDALLPHGDDTPASVGSLAGLLSSFGVNERLVRTSLSRLVNDDLLAVDSEGRRSFYRVAPGAIELFRRADERIYRGGAGEWDGSWTIVVIDGSESTPNRRTKLRQELSWAGLGIVAPNVMASPVVDAEVVASVVARVGGFEQVLVARSSVVEGAGTLGAEELARRCAPLDDIASRYGRFVDRFSRFDAAALARLDVEQSFKLRLLLVAAFRRIVLADPSLPAPLVPADWIGDRARRVAAAVYGAVVERAEAFLLDTVEPALGAVDTTGRFPT
jgi:phenylacetic acid degradation operon negative regulatory protein